MPHRRPSQYSSSEVSHQHPEISGVRTTNTVVVGNGPAALCLSYLLHGNIPFYDPVTHGPHPDPVLHKKLSKTLGKPLFYALDTPQQSERLTDHFPASNLSYSTQALPLNALLDTLQRPNADTELGEVKGRLRWEKWPQKSVEHMVLGSAPDAGGQWTEDPVSTNWDIGTLSYSEMFSLPGYTFPEHYRRLHKKLPPELVRPTRRDVSSYYAAYPRAVGIASAVYSNVYVKRISRNQGGFTVQVQRRKTGEIFVVLCRHLVLASGIFSYTIPPPPIFLPLLQRPKMQRSHTDGSSGGHNTVLVIGSGFTAADVILSTPPNKRIIHIYKWNPDRPSPLKGCHPQAYPEYAEIYRRMKLGTLGTSTQNPRSPHTEHPGSAPVMRDWETTYQGFPNAQVIAVSGDGKIKLLTIDEEVIEREITELKYCVGRRGSLGYLSTDLRKEVGALDVAWVSADTLRRRVETGVEVVPGVFVIGSLTGDSLVRYVAGACTYAAGKILKESEDRKALAAQHAGAAATATGKSPGSETPGSCVIS
ncbi:hypothetical protein EX30DRAFT_341939 [Ascodesmis nigricans]|uniref:FAD/NAD(P)-binding domain-containing protein n=1 Tax=Ascodesmis nigricans TaxID=341454 RepID=A0A4S2MTM1_9PEZI|nr:hypothetical protein EX30DRAFT_341939 [Ascodesmis nigricans]